MKAKLQIILALIIIASSVLWGQTTYTSTATGNWSTMTWSPAGTPGASDNVVIADGHTVTINQNISITNLTVGQGASGILTFQDNTTARTVSISEKVVISSGATFITQSTATATHTMNIGGDLTNNGTFDMSRGGSTLICNVTFNKAGDQIITGATPLLTRFRGVTLNKTSVSNKVICNINVSIAGSNLFVFTAGTWEQTANTLFITSGSQTIAATGVLNIIGSGNFDMAIAGSWTVQGTITVNTSGYFSMGSGNNSFVPSVSTAVVNFTAGTVNIYGRLTLTAGTTTINGANIFIDPQATNNLAATSNVFEIAAAANFSFSSGSVTIVDPVSGGTTGREIRFRGPVTGTQSITGGVIYLGDGSSASLGTGYKISCDLTSVPLLNLVIQTGTASERAPFISTNNTPLNGTLTMISGVFTGTNAFSYGGSSTLVYQGSIAQTTSNIEFPATNGPNNLTINNSNGVNLHASRTVNGTLTLTNGVLNTGLNTLSIASTGNVVRTNGYVLGKLQKYIPTGSNVASSFEIGTINGYSPVNLVFNEVTGAGNFIASIINGLHPNVIGSGLDTNKTANQYWNIDNLGATFDTYNGILNFNTADLKTEANPSNFVARAFDGGSWAPVTVGTKTATSIQINSDYISGENIAIGEPVNFKITASAGPNGSIDPLGDIFINAYGVSQKFTYAPDMGYYVDSVIVNGVKVDSSSSYTFINVDKDHTIRVVFAMAQYTITATAGENGAIEPSGAVGVSGVESKVFSFRPNTGYHVDSVYVDGVYVPDSTTRYTFTNVSSDHTIHVTFAINQYTISASAGPNGLIIPSGNTVVDYGSSINYTFVPDDNYQVDSLFVDGFLVADSTTSYTFTNISADRNIRVVFGLKTFALTASAGIGGTISPSGVVLVRYSENQKFIITPLAGYLLDSLFIDGVREVDSTTSYTFINVTAPHTIRAVFYTNIRSISSNGTGGGNWNNAATWQGGFIPSEFDTVTVLGTDSVSVVGGPVCSVIHVKTNGKLNIPSNDSLTIKTPDISCMIDGRIINAGLIKMQSTARLQFNDGSRYQHVRNGGSLPLGVWGVGSTCEITGIAGTSPSNGNQNFHNLTWNNPSHSGNLNLGWNSGTVNIGGNIRVINTGSGRLQPCAPLANTSVTVNVQGNIVVDGSSSSNTALVSFTSNGTGNANTHIVFNVYGNVVVTGNPSDNAWTNFSISRGSQGGNGTSTWNFYGDVSVSNAQIQNSTGTSGGGLGKFVFAKSGVQSLTFNNLNSSAAAINIEVLSGSTLNVGSGTLTPSNGFFTLSAGGSLQTAHANGINGNLTNTGAKTLSKSASYTFNGTAAQVTGTLLPDTVNNLTIDNSNGVKLTRTTVINGVLRLRAGVFDNTIPFTLGSIGSVAYQGGSLLFPASARVVTIAEARKDVNADLISDYSVTKDTLIIYGVITSPNYQTTQTGYFMQDQTAGINLFSFTAPYTSFELGDSVKVVGTLLQFRGLTEFVPLTMTSTHLSILKKNAVVPAPQVLSLGEYVTNAEKYEGSLIRIDTLYKSSGAWPATGSNAWIYMKKFGGTDSVLMFIDRDTEIDGTVELSYPISVIGIAMQYSSGSAVYNDGYQIMPRYSTDLIPIIIVSVEEKEIVPREFSLSQNYPNPFNPVTNIQFTVEKDGFTSLKVFNLLGQQVATIFEGEAKAGQYYKLSFNGNKLSSGVYFYALENNNQRLVKKLMLTK